MPHTTYLKMRTRIIVSVAASTFIIFFNRPLDLVDALTYPKFYLIYSFSAAVAFLLVSITHFFTIWLDRRMKWEESFTLRLILQAALGFLLPAFVDLFIYKIYFDSAGESIFDNEFFSIDWVAVCILLICLNLWYYGMYERKRNSLLKRDIDAISSLNLEYRGREYVFNVKNDVLYFASINKQVRAYTRTGESYPVNENLAALAEKFEASRFMRINRTLVVNLDIIKDYRNGEKRHTLELDIKPNIIIDPKNLSLFVVTRDNINSFKEELSK